MKEGTYMSELNYMIEMLELKDNNIKFYEICYHKEKIKRIFHKVFEGTINLFVVKNMALFLMIILRSMDSLLLILKYLMLLALKLF